MKKQTHSIQINENAFNSILEATKNYLQSYDKKDIETLTQETNSITSLIEENFSIAELPSLRGKIVADLKTSFNNKNDQEFKALKTTKDIFDKYLLKTIFSLAESDFKVTRDSVINYHQNDETIYSLLNCLDHEGLQFARGIANYDEANYKNMCSYENVSSDVLIDATKKLNGIQKVRNSIVFVTVDKRIDQVKEINSKYSNDFYRSEELTNLGRSIQDDYREMDYMESFIANQRILGKLIVAEEALFSGSENSKDSDAKNFYDAVNFVNSCYEAVDQEYDEANANAESSEM